MKKSLRLIMFGVLLWVIPFFVSFAFYDSNGTLAISYDLFKSSMISSLAGSFFMYLYFKTIAENFVREGIIAGVVWLVINLVLDIFILVPFSKMEMKDYIVSIGIRYLQIPVFSFLVGKVLQSKINVQ